MTPEIASLAEASRRSGRMANWINAKINGRETSSSVRHRSSGACFVVALDHHIAIVTLIERSLYASAFALCRLQFEAYVRASWLFHLGVDEWFNLPVAKRFWPSLGLMIEALETTEIFHEGPLSSIFTANRFLLNDLTHTGFQQIHRWNTASSIEQDFPECEIRSVLSFADAVALLAAGGLAVLLDDEPLSQEILVRTKDHAYLDE